MKKILLFFCLLMFAGIVYARTGPVLTSAYQVEFNKDVTVSDSPVIGESLPTFHQGDHTFICYEDITSGIKGYVKNSTGDFQEAELTESNKDNYYLLLCNYYSYIKYVDVTIMNEFDLDKYYSEISSISGHSVDKHNSNYYVIDSGVKLYKGPGLNYDKEIDEEIPVGTILNSEDNVNDWLYVTYNNHSGWIENHYIYHKGNGLAINKTPIASDCYYKYLIAPIKQDVYSKPFIDNPSSTLEVNQEIELKYCISNTYEAGMPDYPTYGYIDNVGWIKTSHMSGNESNMLDIYYWGIKYENLNLKDFLKDIKSIRLFNTVNDTEPVKIIENLDLNKLNELYSVLYVKDDAQYTYYYVDYDGFKGWYLDNLKEPTSLGSSKNIKNTGNTNNPNTGMFIKLDIFLLVFVVIYMIFIKNKYKKVDKI